MALADSIVGIIGNVVSILMFLAPVKTFIKIIKAKSTMEFKSTPYVCTLLSVLLWTLYGFLKPATLIITINGAGTFLQVLYVSCFFFYADRRGRVRTSQSLLLVLAIFGIVLAAALTATNAKATRVMITGILSVVFSIVMYASPLRAMKMVVQTKSVTFMPFTLSAILLLNGTVWLAYALLVKDIYVSIPNGVGMFFGILQICLYLLYMKKSKKLAEEAEKSRLQNNGHLKSDASNGDHSTDVEKGTLPKDQLTMEQDMKYVQDVPVASTDAGSEFTNVPLEDKTVNDSQLPTSTAACPLAQTTQPDDSTLWNPLSATD